MFKGYKNLPSSDKKKGVWEVGYTYYALNKGRNYYYEEEKGKAKGWLKLIPT